MNLNRLVMAVGLIFLVTVTGCAICDKCKMGGSNSVTLFDGKTFNGWEGNLELFRIEDGAIVAGSMEKDIPRNEFLCTEKEYGDFELRLQAKLIGEGDNAGIQFRSHRVPDDSEVSGYQADMGGESGEYVFVWGCLYDESRRNTMLVIADTEKLAKVLKLEGWNEYVIRCEGNHIQLWVNGLQTVDYTEKEESIPIKGIIGLQIHGGEPAEAWYKDIVIKEIR